MRTTKHHIQNMVVFCHIPERKEEGFRFIEANDPMHKEVHKLLTELEEAGIFVRITPAKIEEIGEDEELEEELSYDFTR